MSSFIDVYILKLGKRVLVLDPYSVSALSELWYQYWEKISKVSAASLGQGTDEETPVHSHKIENIIIDGD